MDILVLVCIGEGEVACSPMTMIQQQPNIRKKKLTCNVEIRFAISFSFKKYLFKTVRMKTVPFQRKILEMPKLTHVSVPLATLFS